MELIQPKSIPNRLLHYLALQIKACGAVAGDGEDEGLWGLPRAEVFFGDREAQKRDVS